MKRIALILAAAVLPLMTQSTFAQKQKDFHEYEEFTPNFEKGEKSKIQKGALEIESYDQRKTSFAEIQDAAVAHVVLIENFAKAFQNGAGNVAPIPEPARDTFRYLSALYLHCSVNFGTCPSVLDLVREADVINSRLTRTPKCSQTEMFWNMWKADDMEARHSHRVKIGFMNETSSFRANTRPKYKEECVASVTEAIAGSQSDEQFFKNRYKAGSPLMASLSKASKIAHFIKGNYDKARAEGNESAPSLYALVGIG